MKSVGTDGLSTVDPKDSDFNEMEAMDHHHTLMKAEMIKSDPKKMAMVKKIAGRHLKGAQAISSIADIKAAGAKMRQSKKNMQEEVGEPVGTKESKEPGE